MLVILFPLCHKANRVQNYCYFEQGEQEQRKKMLAIGEQLLYYTIHLTPYTLHYTLHTTKSPLRLHYLIGQLPTYDMRNDPLFDQLPTGFLHP